MSRRSALCLVSAITLVMILTGFTNRSHAPVIMECGKSVAYNKAFVEKVVDFFDDGVSQGETSGDKIAECGIGRLCFGVADDMVRSAEKFATKEQRRIEKKNLDSNLAKKADNDKAESGDESTVDGASVSDETAETESAEDESSGPSEYWFEVGGRGEDQGLIDAGYLTEWQPEYYCAHIYTSHGEMINALQVGDLVHVDGGTVRICGCSDFLKDSYYEDIRALLPNAVCFQTCYPGGSDWVMVKYGYWQ